VSDEMNVHRVDCKRSAPLFQAAAVCNMHVNSLHIFPWNIPLVLNDKGGLMPRTEFKQAVKDTLIFWLKRIGVVFSRAVESKSNSMKNADADGWDRGLKTIFSATTELIDGEDIISCAGVQSSYSDFMEYIAADVLEGA